MQGTRIGIRFNKVCGDLEELVRIALSERTKNEKTFQGLIKLVVIRLHDEWGLKCRSIVIKSAIGSFRTRSGRILPRSPALGGNKSALEAIRKLWTSKRKMSRSWEPRWHEPYEATRAARLLKVGNEQNLLASFGAGPSPENLRIVRNVIVHSSPNCWYTFQQFASSLGFHPGITPVELACTRTLYTGERYIQTWINDLRDNIWAAIK